MLPKCCILRSRLEGSGQTEDATATGVTPEQTAANHSLVPEMSFTNAFSQEADGAVQGPVAGAPS